MVTTRRATRAASATPDRELGPPPASANDAGLGTPSKAKPRSASSTPVKPPSRQRGHPAAEDSRRQPETIPEAPEEHGADDEPEPRPSVMPATTSNILNSQVAVHNAPALPEHGSEEEEEEEEEESESEAEDPDDDFLGGHSMEQLAASIRHALQAKHFNRAGASGTQSAAAAGPSTSSNEGGDTEGEEDEVAARRRKQQEKAERRRADGEVGEVSRKVLRWQPKVDLPKQPASQRLVHQRGPIKVEKEAGMAKQREPMKVEKEAGMAKQLLAPPRDPTQLGKASKKAAPDTAGASWFNMPATKIDDKMKQELRLLRLRGAFDTKRFYKGFDRTKFPKYFQLGKVVDNAVDFYGSRLTRAERKATLTDQLLADRQLSQTRKRRFNKVQQEAQRYAPANKNKKGEMARIKKNVKHASR